MAVQYIVGNDGNISLGTLGFGSLAAWSATFSRTSTAISGYSDTIVRRRLGVLDATGSAAGHMIYDAANNTPTGHLIAGTDGSAATNVMDGQNIALYINDGDSGAAANPVPSGGGAVANTCGFNLTVVVSSIAVSSDKNGDATVSFNWELSGLAAEVWDES